MTPTPHLARLLCTSTLLLLGANAHAQTGAAEIGAIQRLEREQLERLRQEQRLQQRPATPDIELPAALAPGAASQQRNIPVKRFEVGPSLILSEAELRTALAPFENRTLSLNDLFDAVAAINRLYDARNMPTARAVLPPQDIQNGLVRIRLVEAKVGAVVVGAEHQVSDTFVRERLRLQEGALLSVPELEADLVRFNRLHQAQLRASVKPGQASGTTDVELIAQEPLRQRVQVYVDNAGRNTVGEIRLGVLGQWNGLRGRDDALQLSGVAAQGSTSVATNYSTALTPDDWRLDLGFNADRIKIIDGPFEPLDIGGSSYALSVGVSKPLVVSAEQLWLGYARLANKSSESTFGGIAQVKSRLTVLTAGVSGDRQLDGSVWTLDANVNLGNQTSGGSGSFWSARANAAWLKPWGPGTQWVLRGGLQVSPTDLLPSSEQFQVGGSVSVRGYSEGLLTGRSGYLASVELRQQLHSPAAGSGWPFVTGLAFVDHGGAFPFRPSPLSDVTRSDFLTSAGLGVVADWSQRVQARVTLGWPLRNKQLETDLSEPRLHAAISVSWP